MQPGTAVERDAVGDCIKPAAEGPIHPHRSGFSHENEKRRLEGILRLVGIAEYAVADPPDHCAMAIHQGRKSHFRRCRRFGRFGPPGVVLVEELAVGEPRRRPDLNRARNCRNGPPGCPLRMIVRLAVKFVPLTLLCSKWSFRT